MNLSKRRSKILYYLYNYRNCSLKQLCDKLNITPQTFRNEIQNLGDLFQEYNIQVNIHKNGEIEVVGRERYNEFLREIDRYLEFPLEYKIMLYLVLADDFVVLQDMADCFYLSKSNLEKQMPIFLKDHKEDIVSVRHYGIKYNDSQIHRRHVFVKLIYPYIYGIDFKKEIEAFDELHFPILSYIHPKYVDKATMVISDLLEMDCFVFNDVSSRKLFLLTLFMVWNNAKDSPEYIEESKYDEIRYIKNVDQYFDIIERLNTKYHLQCTEKEIKFFCFWIIVFNSKKETDSDELQDDMRHYTDQIMSEIYEKYAIDVSRDKDFVKAIGTHIYMMLLKGKQNELDTDWNGLDIRKQYPLAFEMAMLAGDIISKNAKFKVSNSEINYLLMHFQIALEHLKTETRRIKTLLVCHYGMVAAKLISTKVERKFPEIQIEQSYSVQEYLKSNDGAYDLILSTGKLPSSDLKIIYISVSLEEDDLDRISSFVRHKSVGSMLSMKIFESDIIHIKNNMNQNQVIDYMSDILIKTKNVLPEYKESVKNREKISSTNMNIIALPHGDPGFVNESKLIIARADDTIEWADGSVKYIFLFAFSKCMVYENASIFSSFYRGLASAGVEEKIAGMDELSDIEFKKKLIDILVNER